ncbi:MAG: hypothetical protein M0Z81_11955 [Deltaproteobacteria bacterium]|nr:hypothetical protein [Deltaproteobacteria bacterium]
MGKKPRVPVLACFLCLFCVTAFSGCGSGAKGLVGSYKAETSAPSPHGSVSMELKETGAGVWMVGDNEITFSWHVKGDQLRLYTKNGGIITGELKGGVIQISLPGLNKLSFKKTK